MTANYKLKVYAYSRERLLSELVRVERDYNRIPLDADELQEYKDLIEEYTILTTVLNMRDSATEADPALASPQDLPEDT